MRVSYDYDSMEYYELIWLYERFAEQRSKENSEPGNKGGMSIEELINAR
jgi:hypothetical protein